MKHRQCLRDALAKAQSLGKRGQQAQIFILLADVRARTGHTKQAMAYLENAGEIATGNEFYSLEADAMVARAKLYRDNGDLDTADAKATQGLAAAGSFEPPSSSIRDKASSSKWRSEGCSADFGIPIDTNDVLIELLEGSRTSFMVVPFLAMRPQFKNRGWRPRF